MLSGIGVSLLLLTYPLLCVSALDHFPSGGVGAFLVTVNGGAVNVTDGIKTHSLAITGSENASGDILTTLKPVWKECYASILMGNTDAAASFFASEMPSVLRSSSQLGGAAKIHTVVMHGKMVRLVVEFTFNQSNNNTLTIFDAHTWQRNESGKWEVQSLIY